MPSIPPSGDEMPAARQLKEARAALEAATQACDQAFRAWLDAPSRDRAKLEAAARGFSEAQRRFVHAQAAARQGPDKERLEKSWGAH